MRFLSFLLLLLSGAALSQRTDLQTVQAIQNVRLKTQQGMLEGQQASGVAWYLGVPFAQPPLGEQRWQQPLPAKSWRGVRPAKRFGADCVQGQGGNEDCLYLNIYRPAKAKNAPVMVWVHGGFFTGGSANIFDGSQLAQQYGVVVISVNYRVGIMGFLAALGVGEGNYGLYDILQSLRWVKANAGGLGANPANITLFGNSAGSAAICSLMTAPLATGLFQRAILQSGSCTSPIFSTTRPEALKNGQTFVNHFACPAQAVTACLKGKTVGELTAFALPSTQPFNPVPLPPVSGTSLLPLAPKEAFHSGRFNKMPVLLGSNEQEIRVFEPFIPPFLRGSSFAYWTGFRVVGQQNAPQMMTQYPIQAGKLAVEPLLQALTDRYFACPNNWLAKQFAAWSPTYIYEFSDAQAPQEVNNQTLLQGPVHGSEIPFVLSTAVSGVASPLDFSFAQRRLARQMGDYWTTFAATGKPASLGLTLWPAATLLRSNVLKLNSGQTSLITNFAAEHQCDFWENIDP